MSARFAATLLVLGWLLPQVGWAASSEIRNGRTSVSLVWTGSSYTTRVELNDRVFGDFIVDTGASSTVISTKLARKLGIREDAGIAISAQLADGRIVEARTVIVGEIRVGRARVFDTEVVILDDFEDTGFDGLLGMSFLGHFTVKIDNQENKLILYERK